MSITLPGSEMERRNANTATIDRLSTHDMLAMIHHEEKQVSEAVASCLPEIARLVDNATATLSHGGRLVLIGAGACGRIAVKTACEFAPEGKHPLVGLIAGGREAMLSDNEDRAYDYDDGVRELEKMEFNQRDMLLALTVSGKTPWVWGAMRHAWSLGSRVAVITRFSESEAAQLASIVVAPPTGPEVITGYGDSKAHLAQQQILSMLTAGLAIRTGRVYSNLRVDIPATNTRWTERQIAIVMSATECTRAEAKKALKDCHHHCRTAILMLMSGLDAWHARTLLEENRHHLRIALQEVTVANL